MKTNKKLVMVGVIAAVVLVAGTIGGVALAQTGSTTTGGSGNTLLARVATILGIDQQKLQDAFTQAEKDMRQEALDNRLKGLVDQGKITQAQADQYKAWLDSKPDMPSGLGGLGNGKFRGHGGYGGFGFRGGPCPWLGAAGTN